jgi:hypothetical protein
VSIGTAKFKGLIAGNLRTSPSFSKMGDRFSAYTKVPVPSDHKSPITYKSQSYQTNPGRLGGAGQGEEWGAGLVCAIFSNLKISKSRRSRCTSFPQPTEW